MNEIITRKQNRLKNFDYSENGYYFITICSVTRQNIFGEAISRVGALLARAHGDIKLSVTGQIINRQWNDLQNQYANIKLDVYVIMPNHIHGIIIIDNIGPGQARPLRLFHCFKIHWELYLI